MPVHFTSSFELKIDPKHRLFIPVEVRKAIDQANGGAAVYVFLGPNCVPRLYPEKAYEVLLDQVPMKITKDPAYARLVNAMFSLSTKLPWDEQGRILLPEAIVTGGKTGKEVTLAGCGDHLQIWNREAWRTNAQDIVARMDEIWPNN